MNQLAPRARVSHGQKRLGDNLINDLVDDPSQLLASLVEAGLIVPGAPDRSPFFALLSSDGPMFKVFTAAEIASWKDWVIAIGTRASEPLMADEPVAPRPLTFLSPPERIASHPTGMIHGSGSVH